MAPSRQRRAKVAVEVTQTGAIQMEITTIGLDLAKQVFQIHGLNEAGDVVVKRRLRRAQVFSYFASLPARLIGMEACAAAHFWARELRSLGHEVRLMPPQYVKAYVKRGKNDAADAAAICEAVYTPIAEPLAVAASIRADQYEVVLTDENIEPIDFERGV
jgi:transposase